MSTFEREARYTVLKHADIIEALDPDEKDLLIHLEEKVAAWRETNGKAPLTTVCVEQDWPEYEHVWDLLEARSHEEGLVNSEAPSLIEPLIDLDEYIRLEKQLHGYFNYTEDWVTIPMDDCRSMFWFLTGEGPGGYVTYTEDEISAQLLFDGLEDDENVVDEWYQCPIYTQRFLPKWVYPGKDFTMVCMDTQTDGNKYLAIFDNSKRIQ